ncbi:MAG: hypothetical protein EZS28_022884 [Streblomastix strix]|uniref:Uncharacterized protein n=1 Tax=Streblomastix strix TaxID=222440 RepID=A0A5J4VGA1_9EUKA|nr:MAG: hypothetical protein EZS28_022884 [Streblomastix strix]
MDDLPKEKEHINQIQDSQEQHQDSEENVKQQNLTIQPWVYDFISNTPNSQEEIQRTQLLDAATKVFIKYHKQIERVLDPTSERANKLERERLPERDEDIVGLELNEKEVIGCSRENNLEVEVETQKFAVLAQHAYVAAESALIFGDVREAARQILTAHNANRIIAGDAQQKREVALVADKFNYVLGKNASVYKVLGELSKLFIRESAQTTKILAESQKPINPKRLYIQQQPQAIQTMFPNMYTQQSGSQLRVGRGQSMYQVQSQQLPKFGFAVKRNRLGKTVYQQPGNFFPQQGFIHQAHLPFQKSLLSQQQPLFPQQPTAFNQYQQLFPQNQKNQQGLLPQPNFNSQQSTHVQSQPAQQQQKTRQ